MHLIYPFTAVRALLFSILFATALVFPAFESAAQSLLPMKRGMAVATCAAIQDPFNPSPDFVVGIIDVRNPPPSRIGKNWMPPMYHGPNDSWTSRNLGQIFGICIDTRGNIYVTATTCYGDRRELPATVVLTGPGGPGGVYKLDGKTGAISIFAQLPNSGPALGNICHDRDRDQFFVTNFEDGKIYRLSSSGTILSTFDPYMPDNGSNGFAPLGERPWGIGVYNSRVYYSIWWQNTPAQNTPNEVRSVGLDINGEFLNDDRREFQTPPRNGFGPDYTSPVSDITFSAEGRMLIAERSMQTDASPSAHAARVMEYKGAGGAWTYFQNFQIGNYSQVVSSNSAGGVDFGYGRYDAVGDSSVGCDEAVWASGDALRLPGVNPDGIDDAVYGITRLPASGNTLSNVATTSYYIDLDGETDAQDKRYIGDVETFRLSCLPVTALYDTLTACEGTPLQLTVPVGRSYRWTPADSLSCSNCREPLVRATSPATYVAEVQDAGGGISTYSRTILIAPSRHYAVSIGGVDSTDPNRMLVPVRLTPIIDQELAERFTATITYSDKNLVLEDDAAAALEKLLIGTIAEGWKITVLESKPGLLRLEFRAPSPGQYLRDSGEVFRLAFIPVVSAYSQESLLDVRIDLPPRDCMNVEDASDTLTAFICGLRYRLIEFVLEKYSLDVALNGPADQATIDFGVGFDGEVRIEAFDALGDRVALLADEELQSGHYRIDWSLKDLPRGIYYLRMTSGSWTEARKIVISR